MKIRPVKVELFHVDRRRDMTKLVVAFHNFANASKNVDPAFLTDAKHKHGSPDYREREAL